jgi:hypothetical protein
VGGRGKGQGAGGRSGPNNICTCEQINKKRKKKEFLIM